MNQKNKTARLAGLLYLVVVICGTLYLQFIPSKIKASNVSLSYAENLINSQTLFKVGIVAEIICWITFLILVLIFYRLLQSVNELVAKVMLAFAATQVPIAFVNLFNKLSILALIRNTSTLNAIQADQLHVQIKCSLDLYQNGNQLNQIFWGLWLFPLGFLVIKSGFLPKLIGYVLIAGCFGYLIDFFGSLFSPAYTKSILSDYMTLPAGIGEIGICLWLLIARVKESKTQTIKPN